MPKTCTESKGVLVLRSQKAHIMIYQVTNESKFDKVIDIDIDVRGNKGVISIDIEGKGWVDFYGEHGRYDFEDEFGFVLIK